MRNCCVSVNVPLLGVKCGVSKAGNVILGTWYSGKNAKVQCLYQIAFIAEFVSISCNSDNAKTTIV